MSDKRNLVTRERVFQYIVEHKRQHDGLSPSVKEIAQVLILHQNTVRYHLMMLEHEGFIRLEGRRAIHVIGGTWNLPESDESPGETAHDQPDDTPDESGAAK